MNTKEAAAMEVAKRELKKLSTHCAENGLVAVGVIGSRDMNRVLPFGANINPLTFELGICRQIINLSDRAGIPVDELMKAISARMDTIKDERKQTERWDG